MGGAGGDYLSRVRKQFIGEEHDENFMKPAQEGHRYASFPDERMAEYAYKCSCSAFSSGGTTSFLPRLLSVHCLLNLQEESLLGSLQGA